jgi:hypothetical protein
MPGRFSIDEVQARVDAQGKNIKVNIYTTTGTLANATCLDCGGQIDVKGSTLLDPRCAHAGCKPCGDAARDASKRKYSGSRIRSILRERYPRFEFTGIDENTLVKDGTKVGVTCPDIGYLGQRSLRQLVDPAKGYNPCRGKCCENRGGLNALDWKEVKSRLDAPGVLKPGISYHQETFKGANEKLKFTCEKHGGFWIAPKQIYSSQKQGCRECGKERVGEAKRIPTDEVRKRLEKSQGGRHSYPNLEEEHGHSGTGTGTKITVVCKNGHSFFRTIESEELGAGCEYCPGTKSSQDETEISFELGQFDPSWNPFDTKIEGVRNRRLSFVDIKLFQGQVIVESDPARYHHDRQEADQKKSDELNAAEPKPKAIYRVREDKPDKTPLPEIIGITTIRVENRASVKERADAVLRQMVEDGFLAMSQELESYLNAPNPKHSGEARAWYDKHKVSERRL